MNTFHRSAITAAILALGFAAAQAQTTTVASTTPATTVALPAEVSAAQALVIKDLNALKAAQTQFEADQAAAKDTTADLGALQAAKTALKTDQQALEAAAKTFLTADKLAVKADQAQLKADVVAALNTATISSDKAAVESAEAKLKANTKRYVAIPPDYADPKRSGLTHTVVGGAQVYNIDLK